MYNSIPFIVIILSLAVMITIIVRKSSQLTLLDVESLPEVREEKKKNELLKRQAEKKMKEGKEKQEKKLARMVGKLKQVQARFRSYVIKIGARIQEARHAPKQEPRNIRQTEQRIQTIKKDDVTLLFESARHALSEGKLDTAENLYISIIRIDKKNKDAYRGLGDVYMTQGQYSEAKQTYQFLLHLDPKDDATLTRLADVAEEEGNIDQSIAYYASILEIKPNAYFYFFRLAELYKKKAAYQEGLRAIQRALEMEPENPKYLDTAVEIAIMARDVALAHEWYAKLRMANPENKKLQMLKEKIDAILL